MSRPPRKNKSKFRFNDQPEAGFMESSNWRYGEFLDIISSSPFFDQSLAFRDFSNRVACFLLEKFENSPPMYPKDKWLRRLANGVMDKMSPTIDSWFTSLDQEDFEKTKILKERLPWELDNLFNEYIVVESEILLNALPMVQKRIETTQSSVEEVITPPKEEI